MAPSPSAATRVPAVPLGVTGSGVRTSWAKIDLSHSTRARRRAIATRQSRWQPPSDRGRQARLQRYAGRSPQSGWNGTRSDSPRCVRRRPSGRVGVRGHKCGRHCRARRRSARQNRERALLLLPQAQGPRMRCCECPVRSPRSDIPCRSGCAPEEPTHQGKTRPGRQRRWRAQRGRDRRPNRLPYASQSRFARTPSASPAMTEHPSEHCYFMTHD